MQKSIDVHKLMESDKDVLVQMMKEVLQVQEERR